MTWTNRDGIAHTVTASDRSIDSSFLAAGASFSHIFRAPGRFDFFCRVHQGMSTTVVVQ